MWVWHRSRSGLERPRHAPPSWHEVWTACGPLYVANAFIGLVFAATAPVAIILSVGSRGGLSDAQLASWVFGVFFVNGLLTIVLCWLYRQPLVLFWTIPGTVLVGPALGHLRFEEVVGAFYVTGFLVLVLGATGWVKRAMRAVPMPVVMAMVAGVFLRFGLDLVRSLHDDPAMAVPMVGAWLVLSWRSGWGRRLPPLIAALLVGALMTLLLDKMDLAALPWPSFARPIVPVPVWSAAAMLELVVPLAITVLVVQNGQGLALLAATGHEPPTNAVTIACGIGSVLSAVVGSVSTCLTGATNAIITASGERERHYVAGMCIGLFAVIFGLLAPAFTALMLAAPKSFIAVLAGLAMLKTLEAAFIASFKDRNTLGSLVAFLVTVSDLSVWNIGAAFWGLVAGVVVTRLLEPSEAAR